MTVQAMNKLPWLENLLRLLLLDEAYDEWKSNIPPDFEASFQYIMEETLTEREYTRFSGIGSQCGSLVSDMVFRVKDAGKSRIWHFGKSDIPLG